MKNLSYIQPSSYRPYNGTGTVTLLNDAIGSDS